MPIGRWMPALLLAVTLTACDDEGRPSFDEDAARHDLAAAYAGDHPSARDLRDGDCFARHFLAATGPSDLRSAGVLDADGTVTRSIPPLDRQTAEKWADAQLACTDFVAASSRALSLVKHGDLDRTSYARCLRRAMSADDIRGALVASLMGEFGDPAVSRLAHAQSSCAAESVPR